MGLKHISVLVCVILCVIQMGEASRLRTVSTTRSWRESLESLENDNEMIETFTPTNTNTNTENTVCMPRHRYESTLRVIDRMKDYVKTVQKYMETCANLSNAVRQRDNL